MFYFMGCTLFWGAPSFGWWAVLGAGTDFRAGLFLGGDAPFDPVLEWVGTLCDMRSKLHPSFLGRGLRAYEQNFESHHTL